jgi:hypothetical protein
MLHKMLTPKRGFIGLVLTFGLFTFIFNFSGYALPACGCGTVNDAVLANLKKLDVAIQQYAAAHDGLYPSYEEMIGLYRGLYSNPNIHLITTSPDIDISTGELKFLPSRNTIPRLFYAVTPDQHSYILRGVGLDLKYQQIFSWAIRSLSSMMGFDFLC